MSSVRRRPGGGLGGRWTSSTHQADSTPEAETAATLPELSGPEWRRVRSFLSDPQGTTFLDRPHQGLAEAQPRADWREAMAWRWWCRHGRPAPASARGAALIRAVAWGRLLKGTEAESYARVSAVLGRTVRASGAVECMNGVLRMQQSQHKRMTQAMLDPKRLYWNCHAPAAGRRKGACPYQHLGLRLPTYDFRELLQTPPEQLTQNLSGQKDAPWDRAGVFQGARPSLVLTNPKLPRNVRP